MISRNPRELEAFAENQRRQDQRPTRLGIFHGQINQEDDGPSRYVCPPMALFVPWAVWPFANWRADGVAGKWSHEYVNFPRSSRLMMRATDWIVSHGFHHAGPPEVWIGSPESGDHSQNRLACSRVVV